MRKVVILAIILSVCTFLLPAFAEEDAVLAKFDGGKITMTDFKRIVGYYDKEKQGILEANPQFRKNMLQRYVHDFVISRIAREKGFDKRPDIKEQIDLLVNDFLTLEFLKQEVAGKIQTTEEDLQQYYRGHRDEFKTPESVRVRHILIRADRSASEDDRRKAKEKIEGILKRILGGEDFAQLASEYSDDSGSKTKGGDLGFITKGKTVPAFEKVAFSLDSGAISDVFETPYGFHIVKVEEKRESVVEPFEQVRDKVKEKLVATFTRGRVDEFVEKAMKDAGAELNFDPLVSKK